MGTLAERGGEPPTPTQTGGKVEVAVSPWKILFICEPGLCCGPCPTRLAVGQDDGGSGLGGWRGLQEAPAWREGGRSVSKLWGGLPASPQGPKDSWAVFCWSLCPD